MFTKENIAELHNKTKAIKDAKDLASELLRTAQDRFGNRTHELEREGKIIKLTEKVMWEEVFYIGPASQSGQILRKYHPKVFEAYEDQDAKAEELKRFTIVTFDVDYTQMTISDYIHLTEGIFEYKLKQLQEKGESK